MYTVSLSLFTLQTFPPLSPVHPITALGCIVCLFIPGGVCCTEGSQRGEMGWNQPSVQQTRTTREGAAGTEQGDPHRSRTVHIYHSFSLSSVCCIDDYTLYCLSAVLWLFATCLFCSLQFGWGPLHFSVYYGHLIVVKQLVNVCKLPPEQKTKVQVAKDCCMSSAGCMYWDLGLGGSRPTFQSVSAHWMTIHTCYSLN